MKPHELPYNEAWKFEGADGTMVLKEHLMDKIDASSTWRWFGYKNAWTTIDGIQMKSVTGGGHSGGGIFISAEDMARFGLLFQK